MWEKILYDHKYCTNEREVESKFIVSVLLPALGYQINMWQQEKTTQRFRLDFVANPCEQDSPTKLIIEAKHPRIVLEDVFPQLKAYMLELNIPWGVLTNGREIRIYKKNANKVRLVFRTYACNLEQEFAHISQLIGRQALLGQAELDTTQNTDTVIPLKRSHEMKIIAVYHNKGGVGKTTTVVNLAAALARQNKRVLIIDLDSQANTTFATGLANFGDEAKDTIRNSYVYHVLFNWNTHPISEVMQKARYDSSNHVYVVPAHIYLMKHESDLNQLDYTRAILRKKLLAEQDNYDIVLIDTPPSLNLYARIALVSADYLIIPSDLKPFANEGLENVREFIKEVNSTKEMLSFPKLTVLGVLPNKISTNPKFLGKTYSMRIDNVKTRYEFPVIDAVIYDRDDLAKCLEQHIDVGELDIPDPRSIFDYKPNSKSADEFTLLAEIISQKIGL